eukprot:SM000029S10459  [mRNA]  locus=s29:275290:277577:- [translate_table: standard]
MPSATRSWTRGARAAAPPPPRSTRQASACWSRAALRKQASGPAAAWPHCCRGLPASCCRRAAAVAAVHTMAELKLTGNHLRGSRPVLTFSAHFGVLPHLQLLKELFTQPALTFPGTFAAAAAVAVQLFATPAGHRKSKAFFDHVLAFTSLDNRVWFRNYQVQSAAAAIETIVLPNPAAKKVDAAGLEKMTLVEVGPRFCLNPIKIFSGSFGGVTLYDNPAYISPNTVRSRAKRAKAGKYVGKVKAKQRRKQHLQANAPVPDEMADIWKE